MTETAFTRKLLRALRSEPALAGATIFKHNDYYTAGVPDFSITIGGTLKTTWWEIKVIPNIPTALQAYYLERMRPATHVINAKSLRQAAIDGLLPMLEFRELVQTIIDIAL